MDKRATLDAAEQIYFEKELEHTKARTYDKKYPKLMHRTLFPTDFSANAGAETIKYEQYDEVGMAKIVANYANDFPRADVVGKEFVSIVKSFGSSYGYSVQDIRAAAMANKPLQQRRANAAKKSIDQRENVTAMFGDAEYNIPGFLSNPNILTGSVPLNGAATSTLWVDKTADEIIDDLNLVADRSFEETKGVESSNTVLLPIAQYTLINKRPRSTHSDTTIMSFFKESHPGVEVLPIWQLKSGEYPASLPYSGDLIVAYDRNPDSLTLEIPQNFEQFPPIREGLDYVVHCHERCGGVIIPYPLTVVVYDSI